MTGADVRAWFTDNLRHLLHQAGSPSYRQLADITQPGANPDAREGRACWRWPAWQVSKPSPHEVDRFDDSGNSANTSRRNRTTGGCNRKTVGVAACTYSQVIRRFGPPRRSAGHPNVSPPGIPGSKSPSVYLSHAFETYSGQPEQATHLLNAGLSPDRVATQSVWSGQANGSSPRDAYVKGH